MKKIFLIFVIFTSYYSYAGIGQSQAPQLDENAVNPFELIGDTFNKIVDNRNGKLRSFLEDGNIEEALNLYKYSTEEDKEFDSELLSSLIIEGNKYLMNRYDYSSLLSKIEESKQNTNDKSLWQSNRENLQNVSDAISKYESYKLFDDHNAVSDEITKLKTIKEDITQAYISDIQANLLTYYKTDVEFKSTYPINISTLQFDFIDDQYIKDICKEGGKFAKNFADNLEQNFILNEKDKLLSCYSSETLVANNKNIADLLAASQELYYENLLTEIPSDVLTINKVKNGKQEFDYVIQNDIDIETKDISMSEIKKGNSKFQIYIVPKNISVKTNVLQRESRSSRFQSGIDRKPNPQYEMARMEVFEAQNNLASIKMQGAYATGLAALANLAAQVAANATVSARKSNFANTPQYIETPVYQNYSFSVSKVKSVKTLDLDIYVEEDNELKKTTYALKDEKDFELGFDIHPQDNSAGRFASDSEITNFEKSEVTLNLNEVFDKNLNTNLTFAKVEKIDSGEIKTKVAVNSDEIQNKKVALNDKRTNITSDKRMQSVVVVYQPDGSIGSGFYVKPNYIVTNYHVIEGAPFLEIKTFDGHMTRGVIEKFDITKDLALVKVEHSGTPVTIYSKGEVKLGETVFAVGHPSRLEFSISKGVTSAVRRMNTVTGAGGDEILLIQTDTPINPGNSGGPLYMGNEVVGVNVQKIVQMEVEGLNFSIHYEELLSFLN